MPRSTDPAGFQRAPHPAAVMAKRFQDGTHVAVHTHERHQLIWASRGVMQAQVAGDTWTIPTNRALWVPAHIPHPLDMAGGVEMRSLYLQPGYGRTPLSVKLVSVSKLLAALLSEAATW